MQNKLQLILTGSACAALLVLAFAKKSSAQSFVNPSFESWGVVNVCDVNSPPDNWLDYSNGGVGVDEANFIYCPTTIPASAANGIIYARSYAATDSTGEGMYQMVSGFTIGKTYQISYSYAGSNLYGGTADIQWHTFINDTDVNQTPVFHSTDATWTSYSFNFMASNTTNKIGFRCYNSTVSVGSGAIDNLGLTQVVTSVSYLTSDLKVSVFPNPANDLLDITLSKSTEAAFTISTMFGQVVSSGGIASNEQVKQINISGISRGIYFLKLTLKDGSSVIKRIEVAK